MLPLVLVRADMKREKDYQRIRVSPQGWRLLAKLAQGTFIRPLKTASGYVWKDRGRWGFDTLDDFLTDVNPLSSSLYLRFADEKHDSTVVHFRQEHTWFSWDVDGATKSEIVTFERDAEVIIESQQIPIIEDPAPTPIVRVFIGHGRATDWRELKDHLSDKHGVEVEAYEMGSRAGHTIRDVLEDMLRASSLAVLIHTPEDELADGTYCSRPNVIHETGLFQGRLGFAKAIVLLKSGTSEFSNLAGVQQVRYCEIRETFGDVLAWMKREMNVAAEKA